MRNALHWLQGCLGLKVVLRTVPNPFYNETGSRWVYEDTGSKGPFTKSAAERSSLVSSENPFSLKAGFREIRA